MHDLEGGHRASFLPSRSSPHKTRGNCCAYIHVVKVPGMAEIDLGHDHGLNVEEVMSLRPVGEMSRFTCA